MSRQVSVGRRIDMRIFLHPIQFKFLGRLTVHPQVNLVSRRSQQMPGLNVLLNDSHLEPMGPAQFVLVAGVVARKGVFEHGRLLADSLEMESVLIEVFPVSDLVRLSHLVLLGNIFPEIGAALHDPENGGTKSHIENVITVEFGEGMLVLLDDLVLRDEVCEEICVTWVDCPQFEV